MASVWSLLDDPWALDAWWVHFGNRPDLRRELTLLEHLFPVSWRASSFAALPFPHRLPYDLFTTGGWTRLLYLAAELLRQLGHSDVSAHAIPDVGRFRAGNLYSPTLCEYLVAPVLRPAGRLTVQPQRGRHGADYQVEHASGVLVAEVKRPCTSERQERLATYRSLAFMADAVPGQIRSIFTDDQILKNQREDAKRLYPLVKYAADQLATSARIAVETARKSKRRIGPVSGVLVLDCDGNSLLSNLRERIERWMRLPWARSIDLVVLLRYESCDSAWGMLVEPTFSRTDRAWHAFARSLWRCQHGHLHVRDERPL